MIACKDDEPIESGLIGKYTLIEVLADPGDGSGTYQPVNSSKTIEFRADGTITSNGNLCNISTDANNPSSGTYSLVDSTIQSPACNNNLPFAIRFYWDNDVVEIAYPCIEPCGARYRK